MQSLVSLRLTEANQEFIEYYLSQHKGQTKSGLINMAVDILRRHSIKRELLDYAKSRGEEDRLMAEEGFDDYVRLLDEYEAV